MAIQAFFIVTVDGGLLRPKRKDNDFFRNPRMKTEKGASLRKKSSFFDGGSVYCFLPNSSRRRIRLLTTSGRAQKAIERM